MHQEQREKDPFQTAEETQKICPQISPQGASERRGPKNDDQTRGGLPALSLFLCRPRGFCAGVVRAIDTVKEALARYGPPVYVRHEIVHNAYVVADLKRQGAIFVQELAEIPLASQAPIIFSAHGVPASVVQEAEERGVRVIDACCPLVTKVHREAQKHQKMGRELILIGHAGHPEVVGTLGQLSERPAVHLIETVADVASLALEQPDHCAYATQTTLSLQDTAEIIAALRERFPKIIGPIKEDICYATTNRQEAVQRIAPHIDAMIIVGSNNSSNSQRLREVALRAGCPQAFLLLYPEEIPWLDMRLVQKLGVTAGASAPEILVENIIAAFQQRYAVTIRPVPGEGEEESAEENVFFPLPKLLRQDSLAQHKLTNE